MKPHTRDSSITVAVRVRPFTEAERPFLVQNQDENDLFLGGGSLAQASSRKSDVYERESMAKFFPKGIRKVVDVVDDRMLIFDPNESNPLNQIPLNNLSSRRARIREHRFIFDRLFDEDTTQKTVYENTTRPLLDSILDGFNATVFAYGATGCGKTHTITGTLEDPGVIFLTMQELFQRIEDLSNDKIIELNLSYLEIYNETIRDLLNPSMDQRKLILREDEQKRIIVSNLSTHHPVSVDEVMDMIVKGNANRTISPTEANLTSSRSHAVLQINLMIKNKTPDINENHMYSTLSLIDLAGSERAAATKNRGIRLHEGANINKSLLSLGNCINALCDPRRRNHVPYRDSKLTRLLKFSLGGNCKTVMIVCISPSSGHYDETLNTLKYANRAKEIKTKLIRNQHNLTRHVGSYLKMITEQKQEIMDLKSRESRVVENALLKRENVVSSCQEEFSKILQGLKHSLASKSNILLNRAYLLGSRQLWQLYSKAIESFLENLESIGTDWDHLVSGFSEMVRLVQSLSAKVNKLIEDNYKALHSETEIEHITTASCQLELKRLAELDGWTDFHTTQFNNQVALLKESFEREENILSQTVFELCLPQLKRLPLMESDIFPSLHFLLKLVQEIESEEVQKKLDSLVRRFSDTISEALQYELSFTVDKSNLPLPASWVFEGESISYGSTQSTQPLRATPPRMKLSKEKQYSFSPKTPLWKRWFNSPIKKPQRLKGKKVRWSMPYTNENIHEDGEKDFNEDDEEQQHMETSLEDSDVDMDKFVDAMDISPLPDAADSSFSTVKASRQSSLTTRKLIPSKQSKSLLSSLKNAEAQPDETEIVPPLGAPSRMNLVEPNMVLEDNNK
ncbi:Kinesin-related motor protein [Komagataella phaffii CBS 7435]|uniref:Kinesin-like protein n=2 Tax=Komagataella phaffii TaxID=460519 RepID=C4QYM7_KOMPG|nr:Kinesin-related motor protein involved in mitotic spindle positioning [Komagataella phaffii GS115]AOA61123.1 GQ67_01652T0 [Komagataella phaffii]CAH2447176.1 Kinesin-related motor protein [Komagataella phaffii CBS 7435]AOA66149.1 GQ68_01668T0 [Komagataella phaffii GS115]CAY68351.1 Kinesin-related motor protein involved in mitotic spindle positioning [Komagataella phaffii GS115]CCA37420.1 Kinesin-related motor protein [Komagataella phaffii CBS 7435]